MFFSSYDIQRLNINYEKNISWQTYDKWDSYDQKRILIPWEY